MHNKLQLLAPVAREQQRDRVWSLVMENEGFSNPSGRRFSCALLTKPIFVKALLNAIN